MTIPYRQKYSSFGSAISLLLQTHLRKRGFNDPRLVLHWMDIVGPEHAQYCQPHQCKQSAIGKVTLFLSTDNLGFYSDFRYLAEKIKGSINTYFGYQMVHSVKLYKMFNEK